MSVRVRTHYPACRSLTKPANKMCTADTICSPTYYYNEKTQPDSKPARSL